MKTTSNRWMIEAAIFALVGGVVFMAACVYLGLDMMLCAQVAGFALASGAIAGLVVLATSRNRAERESDEDERRERWNTPERKLPAYPYPPPDDVPDDLRGDPLVAWRSVGAPWWWIRLQRAKRDAAV